MTFFARTIFTAGAVAALAVSLLPLSAQAGEVANRIHREDARINQGVASGQVTRREYRRSDARVDAINAQRRADLRANGGHLTAAERAKLNRELNRSSDNIYFDKHNRADQPGV